ncbi:MAG: peroxidase-related enzyme [Proteobacteria bacterium]|nr:peroxidase-related enzyme [Pseudomonadota bacterium]
MSWINVIKPDNAEGKLKHIYAQVASASGQVDNVLSVHSLRPHTLQGHMAIYKASLHHTGNTLPVWLLECIGVYVSRLNGCDYCDHHHTTGLGRLIENQQRFHELDLALSERRPGQPFSQSEQTIFPYVRRLTRKPARLKKSYIKNLQQAGYSDGQILEINQAAAYFAYANRTVQGLGVSTAGEAMGLSPEKGDSLNDWSHG